VILSVLHKLLICISFNLENARSGDALEIKSVIAMQSAVYNDGKYFSILIYYILQIAHVLYFVIFCGLCLEYSAMLDQISYMKI
jgi:hypothetical protein